MDDSDANHDLSTIEVQGDAQHSIPTTRTRVEATVEAKGNGKKDDVVKQLIALVTKESEAIHAFLKDQRVADLVLHELRVRETNEWDEATRKSVAKGFAVSKDLSFECDNSQMTLVSARLTNDLVTITSTDSKPSPEALDKARAHAVQMAMADARARIAWIRGSDSRPTRDHVRIRHLTQPLGTSESGHSRVEAKRASESLAMADAPMGPMSTVLPGHFTVRASVEIKVMFYQPTIAPRKSSSKHR
jgi:hypothetical protein